jgi:hypothetical protein
MFALSLTLLTGCSTSRSLLVQPHSDPQENTLGSERQRIAGYVLQGGERLAFAGYVEARGDTLHFVRHRIESRGLELPKPLIVRDIPRDSVLAVDGSFSDVPASILMGVGVVGFVLLLAGLGIAASFRSWSFEL